MHLYRILFHFFLLPIFLNPLFSFLLSLVSLYLKHTHGKALRKALVASAPPGPSDWSNGPVPLSLRARDFMAGRKLSPSSSKRTTNRNLLSFTGGSGVSSLPSLPSLMLRSGSNPEPQQSGLNGGQHKRHHRHRHHSKHSGEASTRRKGEKEGLSLRARAQREIQAMLVLRRQVLLTCFTGSRGMG